MSEHKKLDSLLVYIIIIVELWKAMYWEPNSFGSDQLLYTIPFQPIGDQLDMSTEDI